MKLPLMSHEEIGTAFGGKPYWSLSQPQNQR
jgi:hypothetical protein